MIITLLQQICIMFLLAGTGYLLFKGGKISIEGSRSIGNILIYVSLPCVIVNGFLVERTAERLTGLLLSAVAAILILLISMAVSHVFFRKDPIAEFATAFSNAGFCGVPLIVAQFNEGAVFYIAAFIALLNLLQWTYGVSLLTGERSGFHWKKFYTAPFFIAIAIGIVLFLIPWQLPAVFEKSLDFMANLNTPLAMFVTGVYFAQSDLKKLFFKKRLYTISVVRLLVIPMISILVLAILPNQLLELKMAILIAAACPVGTNVAVYAQLHGKNYPYAVETVVISTILSVFTLPLLIQAAVVVWGV
ncbi:MAG: AEC family transporter [Eubacteriales bacterium]|nr:AEC family transporter [Eubacteriales bacterium]